MFRSDAFRQQTQSWQYKFRQLQSAGLLQRIIAWVLLGLIMMLSLVLLVFVVLMSWILIPLMLYRARKQMRKAQQTGPQSSFYHRQSQQSRHESNVIEGEIISRKED